MNTRDFLLLGSGALVGYLLVGIINKREAKTEVVSAGETLLPDTSSQTLPPATTSGSEVKFPTGLIIDPKEALDLNSCQEAWSKFAMTAKYSSQKAMETARDKFIATCLAKK